MCVVMKDSGDMPEEPDVVRMYVHTHVFIIYYIIYIKNLKVHAKQWFFLVAHNGSTLMYQEIEGLPHSLCTHDALVPAT